MSASPVRFYPQETFVGYLQQHPETKFVYLQHRPMLDAVAAFFAKHSLERPEVMTARIAQRPLDNIEARTALALHMFSMTQAKKIPAETLDSIHTKVTAALKDCAAGKPIPADVPAHLDRFPSQEDIIAYLAKHPNTMAWSFKKKMIHDVTAFFSAKPVNLDQIGIETAAALLIFNGMQAKKIPEDTLRVIHANFVIALKDCAKRKPIPAPKSCL